MRRLTALVLAALIVLALVPPADAGYTSMGVVLNQRLSCRSGPGTQYEEPLSYFSAGTSLTALAKSYDQRNGTWWILVEFSYKGMRYRAYTGEKRFDNLNLNRLPTESPIGSGRSQSGYSTEAWWGPGASTYQRTRDIPAGVSLTIWGFEYNWSEDADFVLVEFYDSGLGCYRRAWVKEWSIVEDSINYSGW